MKAEGIFAKRSLGGGLDLSTSGAMAIAPREDAASQCTSLSALGEMTEEQRNAQLKEQSNEYMVVAKQCKESKLDSACRKKVALIALVGEPIAELLDGCSAGSGSDCVKVQVVQGATAACDYYTAGKGGSVCGWIANKVVSKAWPYVEGAASGAKNMTTGMVSYALEIIGIKDKPTFFPEIGGPMHEEAIRRKNKIVSEYVLATVAGIMEARRELGVVGDRIRVHTGQDMSVEEMVYWTINGNLTCDLRSHRFPHNVGSYGRLWYYPCSFGAGASVGLDVPVWRREDAYGMATDVYARLIKGDSDLLAAAIRASLDDVLRQEAQNPATVQAIQRKQVRQAASLAKYIGLRQDVSDDLPSLVSHITVPVAPKITSSSNSAQQDVDGRMRLFVVGIGMAAAIGLGLAFGRRQK